MMETENRKPIECIGCETCWKRKECARYAEGSFCGEWASKEPAPKGEDPNEKWRRGDEDWETD